MKKVVLILVVVFGVMTVKGQEFVLTNQNFKNSSDFYKDYSIVEMDGKSKKELYLLTKSFVNAYYNNPKAVISDVDEEQIVVDAVGSETIRAIYRIVGGGNLWVLNYKIEFQFKDNKVLFRPIFKRLENIEDNASVSLLNGVYDKKGKEKKKNANEKMNVEINKIFNDFKTALIKSSKNSDW